MRVKYLIAGLLITTATNSYAQLDWMLYEGNAQHTNSLPITTNPDKYHEIWKTSFQPNDNSQAAWLIDLIVADNRIVYSYHMLDTSNKNHNNIYALDTETGKSVWSVEPTNTSAPSLGYYFTYQRGKLLASEIDTKNTFLNAYNIKSGQEIYHVTLPPHIHSFLSNRDQTYYLLNNNVLGGLDADYGDIHWQSEFTGDTNYTSNLAINDQFIVTNQLNSINVFNLKYGEKIRSITTPAYAPETGQQPAPVLDGNTAYATLKVNTNKWSGTLYAFDLTSGTIKWALRDQYKEYASTIYRSIFLTNRTLLSFSYLLTSLNAINADTGKIMWNWQIPADEYQRYSPPPVAATADTVFIALTKHVYGISLATHEVVWIGDYAAKNLALGDDKLFVIWEGEKMQGQDKETFISAIALN